MEKQAREEAIRPDGSTVPLVPVFELLRSAAAKWPERNAIISGGMELTYGELEELSGRFANALTALGIRKGDRVAVQLPNCPQLAISLFGVLEAGAIFIAPPMDLTEEELRFWLRDSGAETIIGFDVFLGLPQEVLADTAVRNTILVSLADCIPRVAAPAKRLAHQPLPAGTIDFSELLSSYSAADLPEVDPASDCAQIVYKRTGPDCLKAVSLTHFNVVADCWNCSDWAQPTILDDDPFDRTEGENVLMAVPWFHNFGVQQAAFLLLSRGCALIVFPRIRSQELLSAVPKYHISRVVTTPQILESLLEDPLWQRTETSSIRFLISAACQEDRDILKAIESCAPITIQAMKPNQWKLINSPETKDHRTKKEG